LPGLAIVKGDEAATMRRHHRCRQASFDEPLGQLSAPIDARGNGEHNGGDLIAGDLAVGEFSPVKAPPCLGLTDVWGRLTFGARTLVTAGCMDRVYLAADPELNLIFYLFF